MRLHDAIHRPLYTSYEAKPAGGSYITVKFVTLAYKESEVAGSVCGVHLAFSACILVIADEYKGHRCYRFGNPDHIRHRGGHGVIRRTWPPYKRVKEPNAMTDMHFCFALVVSLVGILLSFVILNPAAPAFPQPRGTHRPAGRPRSQRLRGASWQDTRTGHACFTP